MSNIRVRFAPSPTGYLHVGGARTALFNYLFAKKNNGKFILRIEDTDTARSTLESLKMVMEDLAWLGLNWDEGPDKTGVGSVGDFAPYKQSERLALYKKVADDLIQKDRAYYCFMTDAEIEVQKEKNKSEGLQTHIESPYSKMSLVDAKKKLSNGEKASVRFRKSDKKEYTFQDQIRGQITFPSDMVGDFVILRSDGMPVYNFCCVVDDYLMKISHVIRAEEHLPNTLRQLMIYDGMDWKPPQFAHLSLVLDEDKQKLSKRKGATSCHEFKKEGYLPEALNNFIALLGWSHPEEKEILSLDEITEYFDISRINHSGAVFDAVKLKWMNAQYLRAKPDEEIWKLIYPFLTEVGLSLSADKNWQLRSVQVFKTHMETLIDSIELYKPLSDSLYKILPEADEVFLWPTTKSVIEAWIDLIESSQKEFLSEDEFLKIQDEVKLKTGTKGKNLFMPIRVAVIGKPHGTELKILVPLLKTTSLIQRAKEVLKKCH
jgi:nondiscriminating glutamyl-tRNA synthetase